jgi:hypothetical protein
MPGKKDDAQLGDAQELIRSRVVDAQEGGQLVAPPEALSAARSRHRRELAALDEQILSTGGRQQAALELDRAKAEYLHQLELDRMLNRGESRRSREALERADYLVDDLRSRFGVEGEYFRPHAVGDVIESE